MFCVHFGMAWTLCTYNICRAAVQVPTFKVEASCGEGYVGDAKVEAQNTKTFCTTSYSTP